MEEKQLFLGEYRHSLDAKNRLIMPAKFRNLLSETFYVTKGLDGCLAVYREDTWQEKMADLQKLPTTNKKVRQYIRAITSKATDVSLDSQGRLTLPPFLLELAGIEKKCVIVGVSNYLEIWNEETWDAFDEEADASFEEDAEELTQFLR